MTLAFARRALLLGLALALSVLPARAQEEEDEPLYEIAPREIEIRGRLDVDLPSLERQPLRGLAPGVKIPSIPPTRIPFVGTYKRTLEEIPQRLPEPTPTSRTLAPPTPASNATLWAGGGRYFSRFVGGRVHVPLSASESLELEAEYDGSEGHTPFPNTDTQFDTADARLQFESRRERLRVSADVHGFVDSYILYGVPSAAPDRIGLSGGTTVELQTRGSIPATVGVSYDQTQYETGDRTFDEGRFEARASLDVPVSGRSLRLGATFASSGLGGGAVTDGDVLAFSGGGRLAVVRRPSASVEVGARLLTFDGVVDPASATPGGASANFVAPEVRSRWTSSSGVTLYADWSPRLIAHDLPSLMAENPYVVHGPTILPTLETTNVEGGTRFAAGPVHVNVFGGYRYAPSYRFFEDASVVGAGSGRFTVAYSSAEILRGGVGIGLHGLKHVQASARVTVRDGTLPDTNGAIPYFAPVVGEGTVSFSFADHNAFLEVSGTVESPRYVDRAESRQVGTYAAVDLKASYALTPTLDLLARLQNVGSGTLERWDRYPRPPTMVSLGARLRW